MKDILNIMKQAKEMQARMAEMQESLAGVEAVGTAGAGMVTVTLSGKGDLKSVKIDPSLVKDGEGEMIEDLIIAAHADAKGKVETVMAENPELVERFVGAVLRGLADTLADPDAAFAISQKYVDGLEDGRKPVLEASLPLWQADTLGLTDLASWENTQQVLLGAGLLDEPVGDLTAVFTNEFVLANQE